METPDSVSTTLKRTASRIEGTGAIIKALLALIAIIIAGVGAVLLALYEFPPKPVPVPLPQPVQPQSGQLVQSNQPVIPANKEPEVTEPKPTLNVSGIWHDDKGTTFTIEQTGPEIRLSMGGNSEIGIPFEMAGEGILSQQSAHIELEGRVLGQSVGSDKLPIDITFDNDRNATISIGGFSGKLYRQ